MNMLTADQMRELHQALLLSFNPDEFRWLLESRLGVRLDRISAAPDMSTQMYEVIQTAERAGWTADLVRAAYLSRPGHAQLANLYDALGLSAEVEFQGGGDTKRLATDGASSPADSVTEGSLDDQTFRRQLEELSARVCRVEVSGSGQATGFLVGPEAVLTFSFGFENRKGLSKRVGCRFDSRTLADGTVVEGVYLEAAGDWLIDVSPHADLGYALLRLKQPVGNAPVGGDGGGPIRGWLTLPDRPPDLVAGSTLIMPFYAEYGSQTLAINRRGIIGLTPDRKHVRYEVNSRPGSAGAPCLTADYSVFAIHQSASRDSGECEGVLAHLVRERLVANGHSGALGGPPPATGVTPVRPKVITPPPKPPAVVTADDPQKGRWGGRAKKKGRELSAVNLNVGKRDFTFDAVVKSTDGSPLEGPVVFHLHDTFAKSVIWIRKIDTDNNQAVLESIDSYGAFTIGAQVKDKDGNWIGLEYDLVRLRGLPKWFHEI
jgi:hypothetical protein